MSLGHQTHKQMEALEHKASINGFALFYFEAR